MATWEVGIVGMPFRPVNTNKLKEDLDNNRGSFATHN